jgi:Fe-Mn family superoxide dismutase
MKNFFHDYKNIIVLAESTKSELILNPLPYQKSDLEPVLSKYSLDIHYSKLAKGYVDRYNSNEGDSDFNYAGGFLHNIFFAQFKEPGYSNKPFGASLEFINKNFANGLSDFKNQMEKMAMEIQGSGWVYLSNKGSIKTIKNHEVRQDIILLIDWWEHAWFPDYGSDKQKYLTNIWRAINWTVINDRINIKK